MQAPKTRGRYLGSAQEIAMDETLQRKILDLLDSHRVMTLAPLRPDGWPQATTVVLVAC